MSTPAIAPAPPRRVEDAALGRLEGVCDAGTFRPLRSAIGDGVLAGGGRIAGRPVFVWGQQQSFKGGSLGVGGGETIARVIRMATGARAPVVGFPASGGARLQEGVAALSAYGAIFRAQALADVPQISVVSGVCAGGAAYSPALGDLTVMAGPGARMFLTGPRVVEAALRERVSDEELGGPRVHGANGVAHLAAGDDRAAGALVRGLLGHLPQHAGAALPVAPPAPPGPGDPGAPLPAAARAVYDVRDVAARLLDAGALLELSVRWAPNVVVGFGRLEGRPVGLVATQPRRLGGILDAAASEKGAWFVNLCDRFGVPILVLVDTPGFLPGTAQERSGVIRHGASLVRAFATARVPRATVTLRQAYGGAHIAMNSRELGATLTLAWPRSQIGVMGGRQAVEVLERRALAAGADVEALAAAYAEAHLPAEVAAADGHVDEIVTPADTRERLVAALGSA
jgi:acetyl-CoA carboxylase carboxyltransferase component